MTEVLGFKIPKWSVLNISIYAIPMSPLFHIVMDSILAFNNNYCCPLKIKKHIKPVR